jgi:hypothetical protein
MRKPRLGPPILRIEGLSDGKQIHQPMVDDFTGAPIIPVDTPGKAMPSDAQAHRDERNRKRKDDADLACALLGLPSSDKAKARAAEHKAKANPPQPAYNQRFITDKNGNTLVMTVPPKANAMKRRI